MRASGSSWPICASARRSTARSSPESTPTTGLDEIAQLPLTEKHEVKATCTPEQPFGAHLCVEPSELVRIYSTSGTTGTPELHPADRERPRQLGDRVGAQLRSVRRCAGDRLLTTYNAGPFVAGAALDAFARHRRLSHSRRDRQQRARAARDRALRPDAVAVTPSYAAYLLELGRPVRLERAADPRGRRARRRRARRSGRRSRRAGALGSRRRWGSATSARRSGASARSRRGCTSARAGSSTPS